MMRAIEFIRHFRSGVTMQSFRSERFARPSHCSKSELSIHRTSRHQRALPARGFTLVETMVALAILSLMLAIIFVPLNLGVNLTSIGTARSGAQQSAQTTINRMATELRKAIYVYPNQRMARVTNSSPYTNNLPSPSAALGHPYYQEGPSGTTDVCSGTMKPVDNTARIDFILPKQGSDEQLQIPITSSGSIVTFYARRQDNTKPWASEPTPYNGIDNPIVLYWAQMPYREFNAANSTQFNVAANTPNVDTSDARYATTATCGTGTTTNRGSQWLTQNGAGEPLLNVPASTDNANTPPASDTRLTPLGMSLFAPNLDQTPVRSFQPETIFQCQDIDRNGKIDRVIITLALGQYDNRGAQNRSQVVRFSQVVDLPNIR